MDVDTLKETLAELAEKDLSDGSNLYDHPCSIAIRAIESYAENINYLRSIITRKNSGKSKSAVTLIKMGPITNF
jgi:hypothetical protein